MGAEFGEGGFELATSSIGREMSVATTRPFDPIRLAATRATVPGPVATSRTTAFGRRLHSSSNSSAHGSNSRGTSTSSYALGTASSVNWKPVSSLTGVPLAHKATCWALQRGAEVL